MSCLLLQQIFINGCPLSENTLIYQIRFVCTMKCKINCSCDSFPGEAIGVKIEGAAPAAALVTETTNEVCILCYTQFFVSEICSVLLKQNTYFGFGKIEILYSEDALLHAREDL